MDQNSQIVCAAANGESPYEETPLLSSSLSETPEAPTVQKELDGDTIGQNKLGWIMASVWIGTFCAGLGRLPFTAEYLQRSKKKNV